MTVDNAHKHIYNVFADVDGDGDREQVSQIPGGRLLTIYQVLRLKRMYPSVVSRIDPRRVKPATTPVLPGDDELVVIGRDVTGLVPPRSSVGTDWAGKGIVIHHTAGRIPKGSGDALRADERLVVREIQSQHRGQGWVDIGYHRIIMPSGRTYAGRAVETLGAHAGTNVGNAMPGVVIVGNYDEHKPTGASLDALWRNVRDLHEKYGTTRKLVPHSALYPTACPGRHLRNALGL